MFVLAGALYGLGAGLFFPAMLAQLSRRTDPSERGAAMAFLSAALALGATLGSSGGGLLYPELGLRGLLLAGAACVLGGLVAALREPAPERVPASPAAWR
jgi:predicted MFS family arabinose efflux permease